MLSSISVELFQFAESVELLAFRTRSNENPPLPPQFDLYSTESMVLPNESLITIPSTSLFRFAKGLIIIGEFIME